MKLIQLTLFFISSVFLTSCFSTIKVRVEALNMPAFRESYLYKLDYLNKMEKQLQIIASNDYQKQLRDGVLGEVLKAINKDNGVVLVPKEDRNRRQSDVTKMYDGVITGFLTSTNELLACTMQLKDKPEEKSSQDNYKQKLGNYLANQEAFRKMRNEIKNYLLDLAGDPQKVEDILLLYDRIIANSSNATSSFGQSIVNDPMAPIISALPEQYWNKFESKVNLSFNAGQISPQTLGDPSKYTTDDPSRYNLTVARTYLGNSDIAIKMQTPGEFIVKGVRVDADEAVRTSFKVVSQGIKYLAYSSGIPVGQTSTSEKRARIPELDSLEQKSARLSNQKDQYNVATEAFLSVLISISSDLNATRPRPGKTLLEMKQEALARVNTAYTVYKRTLSIQ